MTVQLVCVDPARVHEIWPRVAPLLKSAIERTDLSEWSPIAHEILLGRSLLWLCQEDERILCAGVTALQKTNSGKVCVVVACGGSEMRRWVGLLAKIEIYAKAEGCSAVRIFGRPGWLRVLDGYGITNVVLEKELT